MGQHAGIDLHRRSTTIRTAEDGEVLGTERFVSLRRFSRYEKVAGVAQDSSARARQSPQLSAA